MAMLDKYCADLFSTQHLAVLIKYLLNQNTIFLPPLFEPSVAPFISENVVIESPAGNIQSFTKCMDIILGSSTAGLNATLS